MDPVGAALRQQSQNCGRRGAIPPDPADHFELVFASRGEKDRSAALRTALQKAQQIYEQSFGVKSRHTVNVVNSGPVQHAGLQAVDYFLWALQRFYEKGEDRFWSFVWPKVRAVHDLDDTPEHSFGTIYTLQKPLTKEARAKKNSQWI